MTDKMLSRKEGHVGYLIFNNPQRHNAVSLEMWKTTVTLLDAFARDDEIRVVVLTGAGDKSFISGADVSRFADERAEGDAIARYDEAVEDANAAVHGFAKPTIAMIRGYCIGGGLGLAACCDMRICTPGSLFAVPAAKLGLGYGYRGVKRLVDVVGPSFTKEIFFSARQFSAAEALQMGLVNRVVPETEIESDVRSQAGTIAANAPLTIGSVKFIVGEAMKDESVRDLQRCSALVAKCFASADYAEGRNAFVEKRKPLFTGK